MSDTGKTDDGRDPTTGQFVKGKKGGPGRPKGSSRQMLANAFLHDLQAAWSEKGTEVIDTVIREKPNEFLKVVASLMPKELVVTRPEGDLTDEEVADHLDELAALIANRKAGTDPKPTHSGAGQA